MNFCNKHQAHFEQEKECNYCMNGIPKHWPHQPNSEQLTLEIINENEELLTRLGVKHDQDKPDLSLLPKEFLEEVARAFMWGEKKYGRYNYLNGLDWNRVIAAALRHATAFNEGEDADNESGISHLGHAGACIAMLLVYYKRNLGTDTRYKGSQSASRPVR